MSAAIAGSEVAITVESMFSMNSATATISGTRRSRVMGNGEALGGPGGHGLPLAERIVAAKWQADRVPPGASVTLGDRPALPCRCKSITLHARRVDGNTPSNRWRLQCAPLAFSQS